MSYVYIGGLLVSRYCRLDILEIFEMSTLVILMEVESRLRLLNPTGEKRRTSVSRQRAGLDII